MLIKKSPPKGHKLIVVATTSCYDILRKMGLVATFSNVAHINYVEQADQIMTILKTLGIFDTAVCAAIANGMSGRTMTYSSFTEIPIQIGVKKVYTLAEFANQAEDKADIFLNALYQECKENAAAF